MTTADRIELAHQPDFRLGPLEVRPATREVVRGDRHEVLEPRVMQVLVALARADGGVLTRDDLTQCCWDGRVVGEDAINRVISRLRRAAQGIGAGVFRIETLTRVGYRLVRLAEQETAAGPGPMPRVPGRRHLLLGAGALAAVGIGGGLWWARPAAGPAPPDMPASVAPLIAQAEAAMVQVDTQGQSQALGLLRRVVEIEPGFGDGWGRLAFLYAMGASTRGVEAGAMRLRAEAALARSRALDRDNSFGFLAEAMLLPRMGGWTATERLFRRALEVKPGDETASRLYGTLLLAVGRPTAAIPLITPLADRPAPGPGVLYFYAQLLWATDQQEESDAAIERAHQLYPMHFAVWFTRFFLLLYTGRAEQALIVAQDRSGRPPGIPEDEFALNEAAARAFITRSAGDVDAAVAMALAYARRGAGHAENAMQYASALGRLDEAFLVADGYYRGRRFPVGDVRFTREQAVYTRLRDRRTWRLFVPSTAAMRADPRFAELTQAIGLERYWRDAGVQPDYRG
jgi:DNA-binding winged helix-turn-helix (wHTH) protein/tetratricopeptide (TPR) repeat protein